jgi:hypothetical protein
MTDDALRRHGAGTHAGPSAAAPYPLSRLARPHDLVDVAREIQKADTAIGAHVSGKLAVIADQIRALQEQARAVLDAAQRDADLHRATCAFKKRPGGVYHLYRRPEGELVFSMLSPEDWGGAPPHAFVGSYRLELDSSWTPLDAVAERDAHEQQVRALLGG